MAKLPTLRSQRNVADSLRIGFEDRAGITLWSPDSMGSILTDVVSRELAVANTESAQAFEAIQVSSARGSDLDAIGLQWGKVRRKQPGIASTTRSEMNFMFYSDRGTFGDINGGEDIIIPEGTTITTSNTAGGNEFSYKVDTQYTLPAESTFAYCSVTASKAGSGMNVAQRVLNSHDFSDYVMSGYNYLSCQNIYPILNGADRELDEDYRFRILQRIPSIAQNNVSAIRMAGLSVPGVEETRIISGYFGIGTVAIVVFGPEGETSPALVSAVQAKLTQSQGPGLLLQAIGGVKVYVDFDVRCRIKKGTSRLEKSTLRREMKLSLERLLKEEEYSRTISLGSIGSSLAKNITGVVGLVSNDTAPNGFEAVYIRKAWAGDASGGFSRTKVIANSFRLDQDQSVGIGDINIEFIETAA